MAGTAAVECHGVSLRATVPLVTIGVTVGTSEAYASTRHFGHDIRVRQCAISIDSVLLTLDGHEFESHEQARHLGLLTAHALPCHTNSLTEVKLLAASIE